LVSVAYTDNQKLVQNSIIQDVLAESEIQKVTIANEKALELYNRGMQAEAEKILMENSNRLASFSNTIVSPSSKARLKSQIEKNNIMVNAVQTQNSDISNKIMTQQQFESKSNVIKK